MWSWNPTRIKEFHYMTAGGLWYLGLKSEGELEPAIIGVPYFTKAELFADLDRQYQDRLAPVPTRTIDSDEFYAVCQDYRHADKPHGEDRPNAYDKLVAYVEDWARKTR